MGSFASTGFSIDTISDALFSRMRGLSYPEGCMVDRSDLRHLHIMHFDAEGREHEGELVCNKKIAADLIDIFRQLHAARYPIERVALIDDYGADDEQSMTANNTSCFCFRSVAGSRKQSKHALGLAIDINPLYNPCVRRKSDGSVLVQPAAGKSYTNRKGRFPYKIVEGDLCHRLFLAHGFTWGGSWRSLKDYQHFEHP